MKKKAGALLAADPLAKNTGDTPMKTALFTVAALLAGACFSHEASAQHFGYRVGASYGVSGYTSSYSIGSPVVHHYGVPIVGPRVGVVAPLVTPRVVAPLVRVPVVRPARRVVPRVWAPRAGFRAGYRVLIP